MRQAQKCGGVKLVKCIPMESGYDLFYFDNKDPDFHTLILPRTSCIQKGVKM